MTLNFLGHFRVRVAEVRGARVTGSVENRVCPGLWKHGVTGSVENTG